MTLDLDLCDLELLDADLVGCMLGGPDVGCMLGGPDVGCMLGGPAEDAIAAGQRDENVLTDLEFYARHPERGGARIQPNEKALARDWLTLRDTLVRPALARVLPPRPAGSPLPQPAPTAPDSNAAVAKEMTTSTKRNQIIAGVLGLLAALGIGIAVTR